MKRFSFKKIIGSLILLLIVSYSPARGNTGGLSDQMLNDIRSAIN